MADRICLVRMQEVVPRDVPLRERSETNNFKPVMQGRHIEGMDYTDEIFEDVNEEVVNDVDGKGDLSSDDECLSSGSEDGTRDEELYIL